MYSKKNFIFYIILSILLLVLSIIFSIAIGAVQLEFQTIIDSLLYFDETNNNHQIIRQLRIPRTITSVIVGASFSVAGALIQGMTRNPLSDTSLLGINSGSILFISIAFALLPTISQNSLIIFSFLGAFVSTLIIYFISKNNASPIKLILSGICISSLFISISSMISIRYNTSLRLANYTVGNVSGTNWSEIRFVLPWFFIGILASLLISKKINILSLGDEVAINLGQNINQTRLLGSFIILILAGSSISISGSIGFIGLIVPHISRFLVGLKYQYIIPVTAILGAFLLTLSDILARIINYPFETPVGAITALIGVPFFLYLSRKEMRGI